MPCTINNPIDILTCFSTLSGGVFWPGMVYAIWIIWSITAYNGDIKRSFTTGGFISALAAGMLWLMGLVGIGTLGMTIIGTGLGIFLIKLEGD